jgi:hypothetical protein
MGAQPEIQVRREIVFSLRDGLNPAIRPIEGQILWI